MKNENIKRMSNVVRLLTHEYPDSKCSLNYENAFQLLIATILSAQCTDERVNKVTSSIFKKYKGAKDLNSLPLSKIKQLVFSTGFYNNKAKSIKKISKIICEKFNNKIPDNINELVKLPGVGRKTANVLLGTYYNIPSIVVDTHVTRIVNLLGFCKTRNAVIIERELSKIINKKHWVKFTHLIIDHGRKVCIANRPKCEVCIIKDLCPSAIK
jgi:endonuclease-3